MRWHVDISSIGSGDQKTRFCVEAEQWQKALQIVRAKRGDDGPFGHFSIELLDDGFRAIDPLTRTRYVVQRAPDDAPLIDGAVANGEAVDEEKTSVGGKPKASASSAGTASRPRARASNRGTTSRASERGRLARGKAPSIPDDPVPRTAEEPKASKVDGGRTLTSSASASTNGAATAAEPTKPISTPPRRSEVPLVAPKPMQAETAFERMTGGSAVALPTSVSASAELPTEVLPLFKVLSRRSEDPTPTSPLTYREMALTVASTTSLRDAEAIARAQFEIIRNAISGAPKGKFIQLAVFDHEFTGKPSRAPIVTLSFKDWRNVEPDLRFPQRDGAGPTSVRSSVTSMPPASMPSTSVPVPAAPSAMAPSTVEAPTVPILPDTVVRNIVPSSLARPSVEPQTLPANTVPEPSRPAESARTPSKPPPAEPAPEPPGPATAAATPEPAAEVIKPAPIIAIVGSTEPAEEPEPPKEIAPPPVQTAAPASALEEAAPATVPSQPPPAPAAPPPPAPPAPASTPPAPASTPPAPASTPPAPAPASPASAPPAAPPDPTPSQLRANAKEMAGDDEKTLVKPSSPPPAPEPPAAASQPPPADAPPANEHVVNKTTKMAAVSAPPPAPASAPPPAGAQPVSQIPPAPPVARVPSVPPPAEARPASIPPASVLPRPASIPPAGPPAPPLLVRQPIGPRRSGDDLITDLFEACSDLAFLNDTLEAADFALALVLDSIPSAVALCSFFDINTREMVVVRQAVSPAFTSLPNVLTLRASEFTPLIAKTMRAGRSLVVPASDCGIFSEDARWRALGHTPRSAISTPVAAGGRYLGLIEVADPLDDAPFTEADGHALTYIGGQFSEYLAQREIDVTPERILRPKLNQLARR